MNIVKINTTLDYDFEPTMEIRNIDKINLQKNKTLRLYASVQIKYLNRFTKFGSRNCPGTWMLNKCLPRQGGMVPQQWSASFTFARMLLKMRKLSLESINPTATR